MKKDSKLPVLISLVGSELTCVVWDHPKECLQTLRSHRISGTLSEAAFTIPTKTQIAKRGTDLVILKSAETDYDSAHVSQRVGTVPIILSKYEALTAIGCGIAAFDESARAWLADESTAVPSDESSIPLCKAKKRSLSEMKSETEESQCSSKRIKIEKSTLDCCGDSPIPTLSQIRQVSQDEIHLRAKQCGIPASSLSLLWLSSGGNTGRFARMVERYVIWRTLHSEGLWVSSAEQYGMDLAVYQTDSEGRRKTHSSWLIQVIHPDSSEKDRRVSNIVLDTKQRIQRGQQVMALHPCLMARIKVTCSVDKVFVLASVTFGSDDSRVEFLVIRRDPETLLYSIESHL